MDKTQYAISAPDSSTYYSNRLNVNLDVFDLSLHYMQLPVRDLDNLGELNSNLNSVLIMFDSLTKARIVRYYYIG